MPARQLASLVDSKVLKNNDYSTNKEEVDTNVSTSSSGILCQYGKGRAQGYISLVSATPNALERDGEGAVGRKAK